MGRSEGRSEHDGGKDGDVGEDYCFPPDYIPELAEEGGKAHGN